MNILKIQDGNPIEYSESRLKKDNPQISFPKPLNATVLADFDCYIYTIDPTPQYNETLQYVQQKFEQRDTGWVRVWDVIDFAEDVAKNRLKSEVASNRWDMEQDGVEWLDANFEIWLIATDDNSQIKMTSVLSALTANPSFAGYSNWKMQKKVGEDWETQFRQTSLEEYNEMVGLVSSHIERCFQAEANCYTKIDSGDLTVTFQSEYDNL